MTACFNRLLPLVLLGLLSSPANALQISYVSAAPRQFNPQAGEVATLRFQLSAPAQLTVNLYDGRDLLIRQLNAGVLTAGDHQLQWDGRDTAGNWVPPEAYHYTLTASSADATVTHDLTDLTGGTELIAQEVRWDPEQQHIHYRLPQPGRISIRIGLDNYGPLLSTVLDWVVRDAGSHHQPWDGWDASRVLDLTNHPQLRLSIDAFTLSDNTLLVGPPADRVTLIDLPPTDFRPAQAPAQAQHRQAQQSLSDRGDFTIHLQLADAVPTTADGLPIINGPVPVRLDIDPQDRERATARRFEPIFFVDGVLAFENEIGFLPMTWRWDPQGVHPGIHYLTANLRGYAGNLGTATLAVYVPKEPTP